jgi:hypothetical protein
MSEYKLPYNINLLTESGKIYNISEHCGVIKEYTSKEDLLEKFVRAEYPVHNMEIANNVDSNGDAEDFETILVDGRNRYPVFRNGDRTTAYVIEGQVFVSEARMPFKPNPEMKPLDEEQMKWVVKQVSNAREQGYHYGYKAGQNSTQEPL